MNIKGDLFCVPNNLCMHVFCGGGLFGGGGGGGGGIIQIVT